MAKTTYSHHISYGSNGRPSSVTSTNKSTGQTTTKKVGGGSGGSRGGSRGGSSSSNSNTTYKYNATTGYYEPVGGSSSSNNYATKYANSSAYNSLVKQYGANNVHSALDYMKSGGTVDKTKLKSILSGGNSSANTTGVGAALSKMTFGSSAGGADSQATRNREIANLMKGSGVDYTDAKSVRELLEKYSPAYASASDEDKDATASRIFNMYSGNDNYQVDNDSPMNDVSYGDEEWNEDNLNDLISTELWGEEENNEQYNEEPEYNEQDDWKQKYEDLLYERGSEKYNQLEDAVNDTFGNNEEKKNTGLTDEQKAANAEASAYAWNMAQSTDGQPVAEQTQPEQKQEGLVDTSAYEQRQTKMNNSLEKLGLKVDNASSPQAEQQLIDNAMEGGEQPAPLDEQAQIAESIQSNGEVTPEFSDENTLVNSYDTAFEQVLNKPDLSPKDIMDIFYSAKDAAALFATRNGLGDEAYQNIVSKIKSSPSLKALLEKYREGQK